MNAFATLLVFLFRVTFYHATGSPMANGEYPSPGAAACSNHFPLGTVIHLVSETASRTVTCTDRGHINAERWIDMYAESAAEGRRIAAAFSPYAYGFVATES